MAPHLHGALLHHGLTIARTISNGDFRASALAALAPRLKELPLRDMYEVWADTLHILAARTRQDLVQDLRALLPAIMNMGGIAAIAATGRAIQDVARWWP
jgi:hypothetical protein